MKKLYILSLKIDSLFSRKLFKNDHINKRVISKYDKEISEKRERESYIEYYRLAAILAILYQMDFAYLRLGIINYLIFIFLRFIIYFPCELVMNLLLAELIGIHNSRVYVIIFAVLV